MKRIMCLLAILGSSAFAQTTSLTREVGPDGQRFFSFLGHCPQTGSFHPLQMGKVETLKSADGKIVKLEFESPVATNWDRKGTEMCAYHCSQGLDAIEIDGALACVGLR